MTDDFKPPPFDETIEERRLRLVSKHGLLDETGEWGEVIDSGLDGGEIEILNPEPPPVELSRAEKQIAAMRLKLQGASYPEIASALGYKSTTTARTLVSQGMEEGLQETSKELRKIQYSRYERMLFSVWERALQGDMSFYDRALATLARIDRLHGLEAPSKVDHNHSGEIKETLVIAEGDTAGYLKALKAHADARDEDSIVDAVVIEDKEVVDDS